MHVRHFHIGAILAVCLGLTAGPVSAQKWVGEMFDVTSHDFGNVPRGAKAEYRFELTNPYEEVVHIRSVKSSCGCTIPRVEKDTLKTYEKGEIICEFNTRSFIGQKSAGVTVEFDQPFYGQIQLMVQGNVRSDIVTQPGVIEFGDVPHGTEKRTSVKISYAGTNQWKIVDVRSANRDLSVSLPVRVDNPGGRVEYDMQVRLLKTAPVMDLNDQIVLVTNDSVFKHVTIPVRGRINPPLDVSVSALGTIPAGETAKGNVTVLAQADLPPFKVTRVECADKRFRFELPNSERRAHVIRFSFDSGQEPGAFSQEVIVHTSLVDYEFAKATISGNIAD